MRRRHYYDRERDCTLCGHEMTQQERRHAKMVKPHHVNCGRCLAMKDKWGD